MPPKFVISLLALNRLDLTKNCLRTIETHSKAQSHHLILTNNDSTDGTREYFDSIKGNVTVIHNETNEGFIGPNNHAFEMAKEMHVTYFVALNNDVEVSEGWLEKLASPLDSDKLGALSGPQGTCCMLRDNMEGYPGDDLEYIEGSCLCAKISIVATQGTLFSDYLDFIYGDDSDLSLRMREAGYHIYHVPFTIKHVQCATTRDPAVKERCEQAQEHNHRVGMKRWAFYLCHRHFRYPMIVKRKHAIGDVLLTTPIIAALKLQNPERPIWVETDFPQVFTNSPDVEKAQIQLTDTDDVFPVLDLNGAYERLVETEIIEAFARAAGPYISEWVDVGGFQPVLYPSEADRLWATHLFRDLSLKVCVMHADTTEWPGKQWPRDRFKEIATWLVLQGWHVLAVGTRPVPEGIDAMDLTNKTNVLQLAALMSEASLFIGPDSFPMHVALAQSCPTVAMFGVTQSKYVSHGNGPRAFLDAPFSIPCAGLRHRVTDAEFLDCSPDCINSHSVEDVKRAIEKLGVL